MASMEQVVEALKFMADRQAELGEMLLRQQQAMGMNMHKGRKDWADVNSFRNVQAFGGDSKDWEEFADKLKSQIAAGSVEAAKVLDVVETKVTEQVLDEDDYPTYLVEENVDEEQIVVFSTKLHNLLLNLTTGEANAVVRRCRGRHGFLAWKKLCTSLNPRTLASGVKAISQAMNPPRIMDSKKADVAIDLWEDKLVKLDIEYGETLSSKMKVAVLYAMLPKDLQERVLDKCAVNWDNAKEADAAVILGRVKEEVKNIAKSRRDMVTPKPMEVDKVNAEWDGEADQDNYEEEDFKEDGEVCFVGKGKGKGKGAFKGVCFACGAFGHRAAECPSKGGGKGQKGKGKGWQQGWGSAQAAAAPARACFGCGSTAHMVKDCPTRLGGQVQEVSVDEQPEILFIGHTEANELKDKWKEVGRRGVGVAKTNLGTVRGAAQQSPINTYKENRFNALMKEEDEQEETYEIQSVTDDAGWADLGIGDITVDSAADESCWPKGQGNAFKTKLSTKKIILKTANGSEMGHYGEKDITFRNDGDIVGLRFQVTDVRKPLLAVRRLVEKGNVVQFGPEPEHNYIMNVETGKRIMMERKGGSFVIAANFVTKLGASAGFARQAR